MINHIHTTSQDTDVMLRRCSFDVKENLATELANILQWVPWCDPLDSLPHTIQLQLPATVSAAEMYSAAPKIQELSSYEYVDVELDVEDPSLFWLHYAHVDPFAVTYKPMMMMTFKTHTET